MVKVISPAQTRSANGAKTPAGGTKKRRKQLAKRAAKSLLKVEQAKKDVRQAERKAARAQAKLEAERALLHKLEEKLASLRTSEQRVQAVEERADAQNHAGSSSPPLEETPTPSGAATESPEQPSGDVSAPVEAVAEEHQSEESPQDLAGGSAAEEHQAPPARPAPRARRSRRRPQTQASVSDAQAED